MKKKKVNELLYFGLRNRKLQIGLGVIVLFQLVTLPVEYDALISGSFSGGGDEDVVLGLDPCGRRRRGIGGQQLMLALANAARGGQREEHDDEQPWTHLRTPRRPVRRYQHR